MKKFRLTHTVATAVACLGVVLPATALAAPPAAGGISDVALHERGTLVGVVYMAHGLPERGALVSIQTVGREVARTTTDEHGRFTTAGLKGGVYSVATADGVAIYRAWAAGTAPPAAHNAALLVMGNQDVARGQWGGLSGWTCSPWIQAVVLATAVAIPIAPYVFDDDDDSAS
jgi:hypothetical protein